MPGKSSRIRTLRDLDLLEGSASIPNPSQSSSIKIAHIPLLPQADACLQLLRRIHHEFYPIVQRRGYQVLSLSELCCCGDGLDHDIENHDSTQQNGRKRRKRRIRAVTNKNILGYNQSRGDGRHTIHLRLRDAKNHAILMSYEQVAGTMAHELAHCVHGPHSASFYKLMDEIQEQHAVLLTRGIVADTGGFPMNSDQAYVLGHGGRGDVGPNREHTAAAAAEARRQASSRWMPQGPQKLGGDATFSEWCTPSEAAATAAVSRQRMLDEVWCLPCNGSEDDEIEVPDVVDLLSISDDDEPRDMKAQQQPFGDAREVIAVTNNATAVAATPVEPQKIAAISEKLATPDGECLTRNRDALPSGESSSIIDLTEEDSESRVRVVRQPACRAGWSCPKCTYFNESTLMVCTVCRAEKDNASSKVISELVRNDAIERVKQLEVERSQQDFGFNIYGNAKISSSTMKHLS
ncbi:WLM domain [Fragilaria crotonensis]|nr:WLM domain [Fragilaria crotonensis]